VVIISGLGPRRVLPFSPVLELILNIHYISTVLLRIKVSLVIGDLILAVAYSKDMAIGIDLVRSAEVVHFSPQDRYNPNHVQWQDCPNKIPYPANLGFHIILPRSTQGSEKHLAFG
jgi:hypothetical protein